MLGAMEATANNRLFLYEKSARRDVRVILGLIVGLMFAYAGYAVDPASNCDEAGNCAPWLVPVAWVMGTLATFALLRYLWINPHRGSYVDTATDELVWWTSNPAKTERHSLSDISRIRIDLGSDSDDIHLYDGTGTRFGFAGTEVIPWPYERWAERIAGRAPHIDVVLQES